MTASILIRTLNEERHLGSTLEGVLAQDVPPHEVIVIDSGSTDATVSVARSFPVRVLEIRPEEWGYSAALNIAATAATGDVLVCLSAHTRPVNSSWLRNLLHHFDDAIVAATWGPQYRPGRPLPPLDAPSRQIPGSYTAENPWWGMSNANGAVRRSLWKEHPFDERLPAAEDKAWAKTVMDLGYHVVHEPAAAVWHERHSLSAAYRRNKAVTEGLQRIFSGQVIDRPSYIRVIGAATWRAIRVQLMAPDLNRLRLDMANGLSALAASAGGWIARRARWRSDGHRGHGES